MCKIALYKYSQITINTLNTASYHDSSKLVNVSQCIKPLLYINDESSIGQKCDYLLYKFYASYKCNGINHNSESTTQQNFSANIQMFMKYMNIFHCETFHVYGSY